MDLFDKCNDFTRARMAKAIGYYPYFIPLEDTEGTEVVIDGQKKIMIGSNNYLGLTTDPRVRQAAIEAIETYGTSCTGSRFSTAPWRCTTSWSGAGRVRRQGGGASSSAPVCRPTWAPSRPWSVEVTWPSRTGKTTPARSTAAS